MCGRMLAEQEAWRIFWFNYHMSATLFPFALVGSGLRLWKAL